MYNKEMLQEENYLESIQKEKHELDMLISKHKKVNFLIEYLDDIIKFLILIITFFIDIILFIITIITLPIWIGPYITYKNITKK
jgi:hypothetical protein